MPDAKPENPYMRATFSVPLLDDNFEPREGRALVSANALSPGESRNYAYTRAVEIVDGPPIPIVEDVHRKILDQVRRDRQTFDMAFWHAFKGPDGEPVYGQDDYEVPLDPSNPDHVAQAKEEGLSTCKTSHCHAGWVVHFAGERGYQLQEACNDSPAIAANLILAKSCPWLEEQPRFTGGDAEALGEIRELAIKNEMYKQGWSQGELDRISVDDDPDETEYEDEI